MKIEPLLAKEVIADRVRELGEEIVRGSSREDLTVVSVLTGSLVFTADLIRCLPDLHVDVELIRARSYVGTESRELSVELSLLNEDRIAGRRVLVVDEMFDTGQTLQRILQSLKLMKPAQLESVVLLRKEGCQLPDVTIDPEYVGFDIENRFVVGYGLDYNGMFRHLSYIGELVQDPVEVSAGRSS